MFYPRRILGIYFHFILQRIKENCRESSAVVLSSDAVLLAPTVYWIWLASIKQAMEDIFVWYRMAELIVSPYRIRIRYAKLCENRIYKMVCVDGGGVNAHRFYKTVTLFDRENSIMLAKEIMIRAGMSAFL